MVQHNADRAAGWNDQSGERWVAHQAQLEARLAVFGQAAIEAAAPAAGERVLDVGCGAGASSLALAARVGAGGQVLGVDISEPLIARARACAPGYAGPVPRGRRQQRRAARRGVRHPVLAFRSDVLRGSDRGVRAYAPRAQAGRAGGSRSFAGAAWPRTIGCACRWARSKASSRRWRRLIPKRPVHSRSATGGGWLAS